MSVGHVTWSVQASARAQAPKWLWYKNPACRRNQQSMRARGKQAWVEQIQHFRSLIFECEATVGHAAVESVSAGSEARSASLTCSYQSQRSSSESGASWNRVLNCYWLQ
ncbi:hypothetical protein J6590_000640 [Homalodisca vitripennis]|nr:hypothetical protein J6590_000640 [Homalodisca vitripennis]